MTSGLSYEFPWNDHPGLPTVEFANELGRRGLAFDPGDHWSYGYSADVVAAVIEVVTGKRFGDVAAHAAYTEYRYPRFF